MNKLQRTIAHALGHYMYARLNGRDGDIQLKRLKKLEEAYERNKIQGNEPLQG